jgi:dTDP-4-dehydrorhamnose 3,5-epimerase
MRFIETTFDQAYVIELEKHEDERGFFARAFCREEFAAHGLTTDMVQMNTSYSAARGTLRGMHYQTAPYREAKLMRCIQGSIYDVIVDVRPDSPTFMKWMGVELSSQNRRMFYVPEGFAHGFLTLEEDCEALYLVSAVYAPDHERGLRYDDPALGIEWPTDVRFVSEKDRNWPSLRPDFG